MKANAPEKIYLQDSMSTDTVGELWPEWFDAKVSDNSIEYTRTDAFIEKATEWLSANLHRYDESIGLSADEFVERFKKAMGK